MPVDKASPEYRKYITLLAIADKAYENDFYKWLTEQVVTVDEATQSAARWPAHLEYLRDVAEVLCDPNDHLIAIPKSRRMMISWVLAAWFVWQARYKKHHALIWQSRTESLAAYTIDKRCAWIEDNLVDQPLRRQYKAVRTVEGQIGKMTYLSTGSWILAVAQGAGAFRGYTPSAVVIDESEFQEQALESLVSATPFAEKGGKVVIVSSSGGPKGPLAQIAKSAGFVRWGS